MNAILPAPRATINRPAASFPVPEAAAERTPARRILQRWDRAIALPRSRSLGARGFSGPNGGELAVFVALAGCSAGALVIAFW